MTASTRPPNQPSTPPPPSGPPPSTPKKADDLFALAAAVFGPQSPARQSDPVAAVVAIATPGGPAKPHSEGGRAGSPPASGAVSGFALPPTPPVPSFAGHLPGGA